VRNTDTDRNGDSNSHTDGNRNTGIGLRRELRRSHGTGTTGRLDDSGNRSRVTVGDVDDDT
jgi:hypothetical protein